MIYVYLLPGFTMKVSELLLTPSATLWTSRLGATDQFCRITTGASWPGRRAGRMSPTCRRSATDISLKGLEFFVPVPAWVATSMCLIGRQSIAPSGSSRVETRLCGNAIF